MKTERNSTRRERSSSEAIGLMGGWLNLVAGTCVLISGFFDTTTSGLKAGIAMLTPGALLVVPDYLKGRRHRP